MPFSGIKPGSKLERDIDKCVASIRADNLEMEKGQAIAICRSRLEKQMSKEIIDDKAGGLPSFLQRKREEMGLSLRDLAEKLPITASTVSMLEKGEHTPAMPVLKAFAKVFNTPLSEIMAMLPEGATPREEIPGRKEKDMRRDDEHEKRGDGSIREDERFINPGATSFAELDQIETAREAANQIRKRTGQFNDLIDNIMMDPDIEDKAVAIADLASEFGVMAGAAMEKKEKWQPLTDIVANAIAPLIDKQGAPMKTDGGVRRPAGAFAFVPDPEKPSSWKLPLTDADGKVTRDKLGDAAAAFSSGGFRGKKVQIPSGDVAAVKAKIRAAYRKIGVSDEDIPPSVRKELEPKEGFTVFKQKDGSYRWLATYSNKFRDVDNPPEIISEASHLRFTKMVNDGFFPYPEAKIWHIDNSRWGQADFVAYDDRGFSIASGTVDKGREWIAESLMAFDGDLLTSHGMPPPSIARDPNDPSIIIRHQTTEISPLLASAAANKFTGFTILGDEVKEMALTEQDKAKLAALNIDPERLDADTESKAKDTEQLEFKQIEPDVHSPETNEDEPVSRAEMTDLVKSLAESTSQMAQVVSDLVERVKGLEANKLTVDKEILEATPAASLSELYKSVIGSPETKVDGQNALAKSGPSEAPPDGAGSRFGDGIAGVISQRNQEIERGGVQ